MKFHPHGIGRDKQMQTYDSIKDHIVQTVQKTYKNGVDVAISLRDLVKKDLDPLKPIHTQTGVTDAATATREQAGFDIVYQLELERYMNRKKLLEQNLHRAYALVFSTYCSKTMQNCIEEHPEYESTIRDNPIELLIKIKMLMHDPLWAKYPFASLTESINRVMTLKQLEHKNLLNYTKRFKQSHDILKSHAGNDILDKFMESTKEF